MVIQNLNMKITNKCNTIPRELHEHLQIRSDYKPKIATFKHK